MPSDSGIRFEEDERTTLVHVTESLARILESIRDMLATVSTLEPPVTPERFAKQFVGNWPQVEEQLSDAIALLRSDVKPRAWLWLLRGAGLTGTMLDMKEEALNTHINGVNQELTGYEQGHRLKPFMTRLLRLMQPMLENMNTIMESIPSALFPGKEIVTEAKDFLKSGTLSKQTEVEDWL